MHEIWITLKTVEFRLSLNETAARAFMNEFASTDARLMRIKYQGLELHIDRAEVREITWTCEKFE